ncbi:MAG: hypothetical protein A2Y48_07135 [Nitrospirae bacterium RIFCSPLOW2_12_42_9]|nr:MAG: hypothetical protein A2Y48_07135 [Nitrospirae bacterium RIFCSPLOW2_12_42_9]
MDIMLNTMLICNGISILVRREVRHRVKQNSFTISYKTKVATSIPSIIAIIGMIIAILFHKVMED